MTEGEVDAVIADVLSSVLQRPVAAGTNLRRDETEAWDSIKHLEIVLSTEAAFGVRLTENEISVIAGSEDLKRAVMLKHAA